MGEQLQMQSEDYELAYKNNELLLCKKCDALTISTCEDVVSGQCFYCGSKDTSLDKKLVKKALDKKIAEGSI